MRERPILFSGPLVRAILEGRKTQTRRLVQPQPPAWVHPTLVNRTEVQDLFQWTEPEQVPPRKLRRWPEEHYMRSPFGFPVRRLWVRETWGQTSDTSGLGCIAYAAGGSARALYCEDSGEGDPVGLGPEVAAATPPPRWRPSIHMPRWASRLTLEVTDVRVERLQAITEEDAKAEGIEPNPVQPGTWMDYPAGTSAAGWASARDSFRTLWDSVYAAAPWHQSPWVWVVGFRRLP